MGRIRVRYPDGFETEYKPEIANILAGRGEVEILAVPGKTPELSEVKTSIAVKSEVTMGTGVSKPKAGGVQRRGAK
jgi:hypothetical protein